MISYTFVLSIVVQRQIRTCQYAPNHVFAWSSNTSQHDTTFTVKITQN